VGVLTVLAVGALATGGASTASAGIVTPSCGSTITLPTTLTSDIGPCPGDGIIIGADNVTLDLNGHTISGDGSGNGNGVESAGHSNVVVQSTNGRGLITRFNEGVFMAGADNNVVRSLKVTRNFGSAATGGGGIIISDESNVEIDHNLVVNNGPYAGIAIFGSESDNRITHNTVRENIRSDDVVVPTGILLAPQVQDTLVKRNRVLGAGFHGISVDGPFNRVIGNMVVGAGITDIGGSGIYFNEQADRGRILGNQVFNNTNYGIGLTNGATRNRVIGNSATSDVSFDLFDGNADCDRNTWSLNTFNAAEPACAGV